MTNATKDRDYPAMKWHPETGENGIFNSASEVPEGWLDTHPNNDAAQKPAVKAKSAALPMSKDEVVAALTAGEIPFKATQGHKALYDLLGSSLKAHLASISVEIPEGADVPALLALVPPAE